MSISRAMGRIMLIRDPEGVCVADSAGYGTHTSMIRSRSQAKQHKTKNRGAE